MSKKEIEDKLILIDKKLEHITKLYEKLEESYSLNKAFIDSNNDESLKILVNKEIENIQYMSSDLQEMINQLKEGFDFLNSFQNNNKNRVQYLQEMLSDNILDDIKEKKESIFESYNKIFSSEDGNLVENFLEKYENIEDLYNTLYDKQNNEQNLVEELEIKINDFLEKYSELIKNEHDNSIYNDFITKNKDFNNKKTELDNFYIKIFGNESENIKSLNSELEERLNKLKDIEEEAKKIILLSSDAGLAGGFHQKVKELKYNKYVSLSIFVGILIIMGFFNFKTIDFNNLKDIDLVSILTRFMINIPFLWIATVANMNLNKYTKLEQEYSHKESLAKSFERYKTEIEKLNNIDNANSNNLMISLMELNLQAFKVNPANSIDKIKNDSIINNIINKNKTTN